MQMQQIKYKKIEFQRPKDTKIRNTKNSKYIGQKIQTLELQEKPNTEVKRYKR